MPKRKPWISKNCAHCGDGFKTKNPRRIYCPKSFCRKYAYDQRQKEKIRRATEILRQQAGL